MDDKDDDDVALRGKITRVHVSHAGGSGEQDCARDQVVCASVEVMLLGSKKIVDMQ